MPDEPLEPLEPEVPLVPEVPEVPSAPVAPSRFIVHCEYVPLPIVPLASGVSTVNVVPLYDTT